MVVSLLVGNLNLVVPTASPTNGLLGSALISLSGVVTVTNAPVDET